MTELGGIDGLRRAFDIPRGITALVGGGGKTTLMLRLARELAADGARVVVTTTTHIFPPDGMRTLDSTDPAEVLAALAAERMICVGMPDGHGKLTAPTLPLDTLVQNADYVLVESDGAKGRPLKAPAAHEPVIPAQTALVIAVAGLDGVGKPIAEAAFRPALYAALLGASEEHIVTPEDAAYVLTHPEGQRKGVSPQMRFAVLLNKADDEARRRSGRQIASAIEAAERVVIASLGA